MSRIKPIKPVIVFAVMLGLISCAGKTNSNAEAEKSAENTDTLLIKQQLDLNNGFEAEFYSKSYSYYWLSGKDTLDFALHLSEYKSDSTLRLIVHHNQPILFTAALANIKACFPLLEEDFAISKIQSVYFREPIYYIDLARELSTEYERQFTRKNVGYEKWHAFLLGSILTTKLNSLVNPLGKKVKRYGIEKFHLLEKKHYEEYLPNVGVADYPEFVIHGHLGFVVFLEDE